MHITKDLANTISNYNSSDSLGSKFRTKRLAPLLSMIDEEFQASGRVSIVDIGGTRNYWNIVSSEWLEDRKAHITIVNLPGDEKMPDEPLFSYLDSDGCDMHDFADKSFDIAHSNSVIEHVGDWERMVQFSHEISRLAEAYFVQTPNYWFPVEPHCFTPLFQWLPKPARVQLVLQFDLGNWHKAHSIDEAVRTVESARLLNRRMFSELFKDAEVITERVLLLPKSFVAVRRKYH